MVKLTVKTQTTYVIDFPIDTFAEIETVNMTIQESNKTIIRHLEDKLGIVVDEIIAVNERK